MKRKIFLGLVWSLLVIGLVTGCGKKATIDEIESYLIEKYPEEEFKILNKEFVENIDGSCKSDDNSKYKKEGYKYNIISNKTNIEFEVKDTYEETNTGTCSYYLVDNYYKQALMKYITEFNDSRIKIDTHGLFSDIKVDYKYFNSIDEISNVLYNFKIYYESKLPFSENAYVSVFLYDSENYIDRLLLSDNYTEITLNTINSKISDLLQY